MTHILAIQKLTNHADSLREERAELLNQIARAEANANSFKEALERKVLEIARIEEAIDALQEKAVEPAKRLAEAVDDVFGEHVHTFVTGGAVTGMKGTLLSDGDPHLGPFGDSRLPRKKHFEHGEPGSEATA